MRSEDYIDRVHARLNDSTVKKLVGKRSSGRNSSRRRVHWYILGGDVTLTDPSTQDEPSDASEPDTPSVITRIENLQCLIFAESRDSLELLFNNILVALNQEFPGDEAPIDSLRYEFTDDEIAKRTPKIVLDLAWHIPVADEIHALREVESHLLDCEYTDDLFDD